VEGDQEKKPNASYCEHKSGERWGRNGKTFKQITLENYIHTKAGKRNATCFKEAGEGAMRNGHDGTHSFAALQK